MARFSMKKQMSTVYIGWKTRSSHPPEMILFPISQYTKYDYKYLTQPFRLDCASFAFILPYNPFFISPFLLFLSYFPPFFFSQYSYFSPEAIGLYPPPPPVLPTCYCTGTLQLYTHVRLN
jgi:hypothetical protein